MGEVRDRASVSESRDPLWLHLPCPWVTPAMTDPSEGSFLRPPGAHTATQPASHTRRPHAAEEEDSPEWAHAVSTQNPFPSENAPPSPQASPSVCAVPVEASRSSGSQSGTEAQERVGERPVPARGVGAGSACGLVLGCWPLAFPRPSPALASLPSGTPVTSR